MHFGERLQFLRLEKGVTQKQLAEELNMSFGMISLYECGKAFPNIEKLDIFCRYFNVDPKYLLCYIQSPDPLIMKSSNEYTLHFPEKIIIDKTMANDLNNLVDFICYQKTINQNNDK